MTRAGAPAGHAPASESELANVRLRETSPGVVRLDHDPDRHDDRAVALALAATELLEHAPITLSRAAVSVAWTPGEGVTTAFADWSPLAYDSTL